MDGTGAALRHSARLSLPRDRSVQAWDLLGSTHGAFYGAVTSFFHVWKIHFMTGQVVGRFSSCSFLCLSSVPVLVLNENCLKKLIAFLTPKKKSVKVFDT